MRFATLFLIGCFLAAPLSLSSAQGATLRPAGVDSGSSAEVVEVAAPRCGRGYHYVRTHRARNGRLVRGHCAPDRHH